MKRGAPDRVAASRPALKEVRRSSRADTVAFCAGARWLTLAPGLTMVQATGLSQAVHMVAWQDRFRWRRHRAVAREALFLDSVVDDQLEVIRQLPMHQRDGLAEALAVLVMLAQDHRYCAQGWISRRELRHRAGRAIADLDALLQSPGTATAVLPRTD